MAKTYIANVAACMFVLFSATQINAQSFKKLDNVPHDISYYRENRVSKPLVKVLYGRPTKKTEEVFGTKIPYGKVWRTGYNEATEIKFYRPVQFGDEIIAAGTYTLLTVPNKEEWKIILSSQTDVWGSFQYNPSFNIAEITVPVSKAENLNTFSIAFKNKINTVEMTLGWGSTRVKIPLIFENDGNAIVYYEQE